MLKTKFDIHHSFTDDEKGTGMRKLIHGVEVLVEYERITHFLTEYFPKKYFL